ncbi:MAG TPA: hypothetical protein V6D12_04600, partial [Candidatus Obscuribacterales bacterium]
MQVNRRYFLKNLGLAVIASGFPLAVQARSFPQSIIKPPRLKVGDTVGLISPASPIDQADIAPVVQLLSG